MCQILANRYRRLHTGSLAGRADDFDVAPQQTGTLAHGGEAETSLAIAYNHVVRVEACAIVRHGYANAVATEGQLDADFGRFGVLPDVGQRLLAYPEQGRLYDSGHLSSGARYVEGGLLGFDGVEPLHLV